MHSLTVFKVLLWGSERLLDTRTWHTAPGWVRNMYFWLFWTFRFERVQCSSFQELHWTLELRPMGSANFAGYLWGFHRQCCVLARQPSLHLRCVYYAVRVYFLLRSFEDFGASYVPGNQPLQQLDGTNEIKHPISLSSKRPQQYE